MRPLFLRCLPLLIALTVVFSFTFTNTVAAATNLKINDRGSQVLDLQKKLYQLNYTITSLDGVFGPETKRAVLAFQRDNKIKITGIVDNRTWQKIVKAKPSRSLPKPKQSQSLPSKVKETIPFVPVAAVPGIIKTAKTYIGVPYKFGGTTRKGFDCSGYLQTVFSQNGYKIPRSADDQYDIGRTVSRSKLKAGDLVFFSTYEPGPSHCGIYLGNEQFIHTSSSKGVRIDKLQDSYWQPRYLGAKRITK